MGSYPASRIRNCFLGDFYVFHTNRYWEYTLSGILLYGYGTMGILFYLDDGYGRIVGR